MEDNKNEKALNIRLLLPVLGAVICIILLVVFFGNREDVVTEDVTKVDKAVADTVEDRVEDRVDANLSEDEIKTEIDMYANDFIPEYLIGWYNLQDGLFKLKDRGATDSEIFEEMRNNYLPKMELMSDKFSKAEFKGDEIRDIHERYVKFDRKKYLILKDNLRAFDDKDGLLLLDSKRRQEKLASELKKIDSDFSALLDKYGVTIRQ